jgi:hypothetical protein
VRTDDDDGIDDDDHAHYHDELDRFDDGGGYG